jgi:hypothetical protein
MVAIQQGIIGSTKSPIQFIAGITGTALTSAVTSVTFTGHQPGDLLLAMGGSQQVADPSFTAGYTKICSWNNNNTFFRVGILVYKFANSSNSDTISFTGTGSSTLNYSAGYIFRNVRAIGNFNVINTSVNAGVTSAPSPSLTLGDTTNVKSALVLATFVPIITAAPDSLTVTNGMAYGLLRSSWAGGNFTMSAAATPCCGIVELLF